MDIRKLELVARPVEAVQLTEANLNDIREWVQGKLAFQVVTGTNDRLYLPAVDGTRVTQVGDWVFYDRQDNAFTSATDEAVKIHYRDITDES